MAGRRLQGRRIAWPLVAVLAAYCLIWGGAWPATYYASFRVWALIPAFAVVGAWIVIAVRAPAWRPRTTLAPAFAAALAALAICTVTSRYPRLSVEYLALAILLAALYLILQRLMASDFFRPRMIGFAAFAGVVIGMSYLAVVVPELMAWWSLIGRLAAPPLRPFYESLTFGNPSAVMTACVLLAGPAVAQLAGGPRAARIAAIAVVALTAVVTVLSGSRAGWLAVAIAIVVVAGIWLISADRRSTLVALARSRTSRLLAVPVAAIGILTAVVVGPGLLLRVASGDGARLVYYATAVRMFESSPLVGTGPGTWVVQRVAYTQPGETDYYIPHAHNIYLQMLSEFGVVGLLAGLVVVAVLGRLLVGAIRDPDPTRRRMGWTSLFTTVFFAASQLFDVYTNSPAMLFAFAIPIAWLDATAHADAALAPRLSRWSVKSGWLPTVTGVAGIAMIVASATYVGWSERGAELMSEGTTLMNDRRPADALAPLSDAVLLDGAMPPYHFALGLAQADTGDLEAAERELSTAATDDGLPEAWLDLAAVRARLGDTGAANNALVEALRLGNQQAGVLMGAGVINLELGQTDAASDAFSLALQLSPTLAGDPWWTADPARAAIWPNAYQRAYGQAPASTRFVMALESGDVAGAQATIAAMDDAETVTTSQGVLDAWGGDPAALAALQARARARPLDLEVVNWCSLLLRRSGDTDGAGTYTTWVATVDALATGGGFEMRVTSDPKAEPAGIGTLFYGHYTYRRPVPNHQLVDWLPELAYE